MCDADGACRADDGCDFLPELDDAGCCLVQLIEYSERLSDALPGCLAMLMPSTCLADEPAGGHWFRIGKIYIISPAPALNAGIMLAFIMCI